MGVAVKSKYFIEFMLNFGPISDFSEKEVLGYSTDGVTISEHAYAYRFYTIEVKSASVDKEVFEKQSPRLDETGWHYIGGQVFDYDEIPDTPEFEILRWNMKANEWPSAVKTRYGGWKQFDGDKDKVV